MADRAGHPPERILLLTFSRRGAREMLSRAERMTGADAGRVWGGTFHAVANRLLRLHGRPLGLRPDFTVLDQADGADLMNLMRDEFGFSTRERRFPRKDTLASIYSRTVNAGDKLGDVLKRHYPWCLDDADGIREIFTAYTVRKREQNVLDYDDLLLFWKALAWSDATREPMAAMFDHVLVDEYQDTNALQADILEGMRPPTAAQPHGGRRRRAVDLRVPGGDGAQHPGVPAAVRRRHGIALEQNYRSTRRSSPFRTRRSRSARSGTTRRCGRLGVATAYRRCVPASTSPRNPPRCATPCSTIARKGCR